MVFAAIGCLALAISHAATYSSSAEAEQGTLSGNASIVSDSGASGGLAVKFGSSSTGPGTGTITAGNSKAHCVSLAGASLGEVSPVNLAAAEKATGVTYNCLETFANPVDNWTDWEDPWQFNNDPSTTDTTSTYQTWASWLKTGHQMLLGVDLIPQSAGSPSNPATWEQACAAGSYNSYATQLAKNLVSYGAGSIVIRLGIEANGSWEQDYVGTSSTEMSNWAKCYDNEVSAMRSVANTHFLFVWNPNVCTMDLPMSSWYPGNSYVDIIGIDAYDGDCHYANMTVSQEGWQAYFTDSASYPDSEFPSLANIETFAQTNNKPLSFPEWGLNQGGPDDTAYMNGMTQMFSSDNFSFESYFDTGGDGIQQLGSGIPNATSIYTQSFK